MWWKISWTDGRTDRGKTVYPPPVERGYNKHMIWKIDKLISEWENNTKKCSRIKQSLCKLIFSMLDVSQKTTVYVCMCCLLWGCFSNEMLELWKCHYLSQNFLKSYLLFWLFIEEKGSSILPKWDIQIYSEWVIVV